MALAKQILILIFISAQIIFATCKDAHSATLPTQDASPTKLHNKEDKKTIYDKKAKDDKKERKPSKKDEFSFPDITGAIDKAKGGSQAVVAKVVAKQMQAVEKQIEEFNALLKKRMDSPGSSPGEHECFSDCDEVFGAAIDDIKKTLDSLESGNLMKANFDVSAVATNVDTCNDCFKEMVGGDRDVEKLSNWVRKITRDALEALQKATS